MIISGYEIKPYADLRGANLRSADLRGANLRSADLRGANLQFANLQGANLRNADLQGADLRSANLQFANLRNADLQGADLDGKGLALCRTQFLSAPEGILVGYKKLGDGTIAILEVPLEAERVLPFGSNKMRVSEALVLEGSGARGSTRAGILYETGARILPDSFNPDPTIECTNGIHMFTNRETAEAWS